MRLIIVLLAIGITLGLFDLGAFVLTPKTGLGAFPAYKGIGARLSLQETIRAYPRNYHISDEQMGFDIAPNQPSTDFVMPDKTVTIFSNELGCMDRNTLPLIQHAPSYEYITGDSFTWGYADYDVKYPTIYEKQSHKVIAKCGITHSGQAHQFEKFQRVVKAIGHYPKRVIIGYFANDVINDYLYPHTTILEGYQVDTVRVDDHYQVVRRNLKEVQDTILQSMEANGSFGYTKMLHWLQTYSLSFNLLSLSVQMASMPLNSKSPLHRPLNNFYRLADHVDFNQSYLLQPITQANRRAIARWASDAKAHSYELVFLLIPAKGGYAQTPSYVGLQAYLREKNIRYIDLAGPFQRSGKSVDHFYWAHDGHWNNEGNTYVGQYLSEVLGR